MTTYQRTDTIPSDAERSGSIESWWRWFAVDYHDSRARFLRAARDAGARTWTYPHPDAVGPAGETLYVDVARVGSPTATRVLLALSGTHGLEAAAGAAVQTAWLETVGSAGLADDVAVVFVHALNPYGYAHLSRTTEHNVDLNRNFVAHDGHYPVNADYAALHPFLVHDDWRGETLQAASVALAEYARDHGADALFNARASGQYDFPDGLSFGGHDREWSNIVLQQIVQEQAEHARLVGLIDWHTGLGDYAQPFFLCFSPDGSDQQREAVRWWGESRIIGQRPNGLARPDYQGLVFHGVQQFLGDRPMVGAVVEFGTRSSKTGEAVQLDQWLRFKAPLAPDTARDALLRADLLDAFVPVSSVWRRAVIRDGLDITAQALAGLASWKP